MPCFVWYGCTASQRRRLLELAGVEHWLCRGRGGLAIENIDFIHWGVRMGLRASCLTARALRNCLDLEVVRRETAMVGLPAAFDGYRILHLSDLHLDGVAGLGARIAERITGVAADLVLLTGDYRFLTYGPCHQALDELSLLVPTLNAPDGIFGIL
ncbi:MAG: metallophosphoesterase, partial [Planctomycetota bacterium]